MPTYGHDVSCVVAALGFLGRQIPLELVIRLYATVGQMYVMQ